MSYTTLGGKLTLHKLVHASTNELIVIVSGSTFACIDLVASYIGDSVEAINCDQYKDTHIKIPRVSAFRQSETILVAIDLFRVISNFTIANKKSIRTLPDTPHTQSFCINLVSGGDLYGLVSLRGYGFDSCKFV